ncbi:MAG TPA: ABC transporter permease [Chloroflexia bacterium]|nr:ABC transporter permease [Chloroflexia bacterium]
MSRKLSPHRSWLGLISLGTFLLVWYITTRLSDLPSFILPTPADVWSRFVRALTDGTLATHTAVTLGEVLCGLLVGSSFAIVLGYFIAKSRSLENILSPFLVASQAIPVVAIAPLLVIWFGPDIFSKILICSLIVFFPVLINTVIGIRTVPAMLRDLMRSMRATPAQIMLKLEIPAALPICLGGLKVGTTLSVIGGVVSEFVGSNRGLGFLVNVGRGQYDTALVFVAVFALIAMALTLYGAVAWVERRVLVWQEH